MCVWMSKTVGKMCELPYNVFRKMCRGGYFIMVKDIVRDVIFLGRKSEAATKADLPVVKNLQEGEILC